MELPHSELWYRFNQKLLDLLSRRGIIKISAGNDFEPVVRFFDGIQQAFVETALGTLVLYSHRKSVALLSGQSPVGASLWPLLSQMGQALVVAQQSDSTDNRDAWLKQISDQTNFVALFDDNPVTGQVFKEANDRLQKNFSDRKLFTFRISHNSWRHALPELSPYSALICEVDGDSAFVILGSRIKSPPLVMHNKSSLENSQQSSLLTKIDQMIVSPEKLTDLRLAKSQLLRRVRSHLQSFDLLHNLDETQSSPFSALIWHSLKNGENIWSHWGRPSQVIPLNKCFDPCAEWDWWPSPSLSPEMAKGGLRIGSEFFDQLTDSMLANL